MTLRALLVTGQSSQHHDWAVTSAAIAARLEETGRFTVEMVLYPGPEGPGLHRLSDPGLHRLSDPGLRGLSDPGLHGLSDPGLHGLSGPRLRGLADGAPDLQVGSLSQRDELPAAFDSVDVVVVDYEGERWLPEIENALERYVRRGGGLVLIHAADNAFPAWPAFQTLCGIGGWGGRDESAGPKVRWRNGAQVLDSSAGVAMHPPRQDFLVTTRAPNHPIMRGLPAAWMHADDELYSQLRGPAEQLEVLATACIDAAVHPKASGEDEPVLMTIRYGNGRVFHTTLGHVGPADGSRTTAIDCVGFIVTLQRGAEWAATGEVTVAVPPDFPSAEHTSLRT